MTTERKAAIDSPGTSFLLQDILAQIARRRAASRYPVQAGGSYFYEMESGWELDVLRDAAEVTKVHTIFQLEDAFADQNARIILIPSGAAVTRAVAIRVCQRHGQGKTIFYEVPGHG